MSEENNPPIYTEAQPLPADKPSKTTKIINKFIIGALIIIALGLGLIFHWTLANDEVLTFKQNPLPTRTIRVHPTAGGVVFLTADFCKNTAVEGELRMSFISETREVFLPLTKERSGVGCRNVEFPVLIPKDIEPDTYKVKLRVTYDINPLKQDVTQTFESHPVIIDPVTSTNGLPAGTKLPQ